MVMKAMDVERWVTTDTVGGSSRGAQSHVQRYGYILVVKDGRNRERGRQHRLYRETDYYYTALTDARATAGTRAYLFCYAYSVLPSSRMLVIPCSLCIRSLSSPAQQDRCTRAIGSMHGWMHPVGDIPGSRGSLEGNTNRSRCVDDFKKRKLVQSCSAGTEVSAYDE
jgi:hypothetical protein